MYERGGAIPESHSGLYFTRRTIVKNKHLLELIAAILLVVGGLNWGLIGLFQWDVLGSIFGDMSSLTRIVYVLIGLSAAYKLLKALKHKTS
jgi:hypothetical protein